MNDKAQGFGDDGATDPGTVLSARILDVLTGEGRDVGVIQCEAALYACLKVVGFLVGASYGTRSRADRQRFLERVSKYLDRQIVAYREAKARGDFDDIKIAVVHAGTSSDRAAR
jgi:hypothetical protein